MICQISCNLVGGGGGVKKRSEEKHLKMYCGRERLV
jgi:hypothetical protein